MMTIFQASRIMLVDSRRAFPKPLYRAFMRSALCLATFWIIESLRRAVAKDGTAEPNFAALTSSHYDGDAGGFCARYRLRALRTHPDRNAG